MAAHTAERRPLGALGRMGLVAALHVGVLFASPAAWAWCPSLVEERDRSHDHRRDAAPEELLPPCPIRFRSSRLTAWCSRIVPSHAASTNSRTSITGAAGRDHRSSRRTLAEAPSCSREIVGVQSRSAPSAVAAAVLRSDDPRRATRARPKSRSTCCRTAASATHASSRARDSKTGSSRAGRGEAQLAADTGDARRRGHRAVASPARDLQAEGRQQLESEAIAAPASAGAACSAGGIRCWHSRSPKKMLNAAMGTSIHGHLDPFFSGSIIVLPTSNRLANLL